MQPWSFYPAFLATSISVVGWCVLARRAHDPSDPLTLSELAAKRLKTLWYFRGVLWICGPLFALTMYWFVLPRIDHVIWQAVAWSVTCFAEIMLGVFPARGKTFLIHTSLALAMAVGMFIMAILFVTSLQGMADRIEQALLAAMTFATVLTITDRQRILFHELAFIFLSHFTVLSAVIALR